MLVGAHPCSSLIPFLSSLPTSRMASSFGLRSTPVARSRFATTTARSFNVRAAVANADPIVVKREGESHRGEINVQRLRHPVVTLAHLHQGPPTSYPHFIAHAPRVAARVPSLFAVVLGALRVRANNPPPSPPIPLPSLQTLYFSAPISPPQPQAHTLSRIVLSIPLSLSLSVVFNTRPPIIFCHIKINTFSHKINRRHHRRSRQQRD